MKWILGGMFGLFAGSCALGLYTGRIPLDSGEAAVAVGAIGAFIIMVILWLSGGMDAPDDNGRFKNGKRVVDDIRYWKTIANDPDAPPHLKALAKEVVDPS